MERVRPVQRGGLSFAMRREMHMAVVGGAGKEGRAAVVLSASL